MPDSPPSPVVEGQAQASPDISVPDVSLFDTFGNSTPTVLSDILIGLGLVLLGGVGWLLVAIFRRLSLRKKDSATPSIHIHPQITVEASKTEDLLNGLLVRAALYRDTRNPNHDFTRAHQDLQEVVDIAEPSGMRLHLTDYHLEMARLLIAEQQNPPQSPVEKSESELSLPDHIAQVAKLIAETGYKRRLPELQALQKQVAG